ncbi:hypothetical protein SEA_BIPAUNETO_80 [Gordonia phage BiPauneto]|nr:hypothetical protein SEA_BIPAUNETO_80 [Gordonia phage BiPauneto]
MRALERPFDRPCRSNIRSIEPLFDPVSLSPGRSPVRAVPRDRRGDTVGALSVSPWSAGCLSLTRCA